MATNLEECKVAVGKAAYLKDQGKNIIKRVLWLNYLPSKIAMDAAIDCVQIHGSYGYIQDYGVERLMRDAKITEIYEGLQKFKN